MESRKILEEAVSRLERDNVQIDKTALMNELGLSSQRTALYSTFAELNARIDRHNRRLRGESELTVSSPTERQAGSTQLAATRADRDYWKQLSDGYAQQIRKYALELASSKTEIRSLRREVEALSGVAQMHRR